MESTEQRIIRVFRPSVVVLCGPAGSGKSQFAAQHFRPTQVISSDFCRALVCDDERDQRYPAQTFALVDFLVSQRLSINRLCVVDSTALAMAARKSLLNLGRKFRVPVSLFLFDVPREKCFDSDRKRERSVGSRVIEEHFRLFSQVQQAVKSEGFDQIVELREDDMDSVQIDILYRPVFNSHQESPERSGHSSHARALGRGSRC